MRECAGMSHLRCLQPENACFSPVGRTQGEERRNRSQGLSQRHGLKQYPFLPGPSLGSRSRRPIDVSTCSR